MGNRQPGILLTNIGTPAAPTPRAVKQYLKTFLSDKRVVEIPHIFWLPVLYGVILPLRAKASAKLYQKIWTDHGSPLLVTTTQIQQKLEEQLNLPVAIGMHYSKPSIEDGLLELKAKNVSRMIILPLYPQYSATSTASTFDAVTKALQKWRSLPDICFINEYATHPDYIRALSNSILSAQKKTATPPHLLFSFHGIPQACVDAGDPYESLCHQTTEAVIKMTQRAPDSWSLAFQSRLGPTQWIKPYTEEVLAALPKKGVTDLQVICPGFAVDCLETLEEIRIRGKEQFIEAGGKTFEYIPALNNSDEHINLLSSLVAPFL